MPRNALMFFTFAALEPSTGGAGSLSLPALASDPVTPHFYPRYVPTPVVVAGRTYIFPTSLLDLPLSDVPVPRAVLARVRPTTEIPGAEHSPIAITLNWYSPSAVTNAVFGRSPSLMGTCQYPDCKSMIEKNAAPSNRARVSSILDSGYTSLIVTAFRRR
ncbi:hypothetical protein OUZ56_010085 [Daphnia magna]|uniref:Uncharacterized protein n=1 Tax=Daphnia magna TaxID=35525 RepID=A0ABR0AHQ9_9CRUS|nr:hypothetical protein OUZ56_010085 [Daphnia magna]